MPRSPSALVIILTCDPDDIQIGHHTVVGVSEFEWRRLPA
jgi:hypothetical protein